MKIKKERNKIVDFASLKGGEVFEFFGSLYMKTDRGCVSLHDGKEKTVDSDTEVCHYPNSCLHVYHNDD